MIIMSLAELADILEETGLPVAYMAFPEDKVPEMPFICYQEVGSNNTGADNRIWVSATRCQVDLLAHKRCRPAEQLLEAVMTDADIYWERVPDYDEDEDYYRVTYELEI